MRLSLSLASTASPQEDVLSRDNEVAKLEAQLKETESLLNEALSVQLVSSGGE